MKVKCPACGREAEFTPANTYRPFCSKRCQTLDLGAWADEQYRVPLPDSDPSRPGEDEARGAFAGEAPPPKHRLN